MGGNVNITVLDGGSASIVVAGSTTQLVLGCSSIGTPNQVVATRSPATLQTVQGFGPLPEAAALTCLAGGTVLSVKVPSNTAGSLGTVTKTASSLGTSTSVMTATGVPVDTYYVKALVALGGTIGTAGIFIKVSLDAGRNYGPSIPLPTSGIYVLQNTGITLTFGAGTLLTGDAATFGTVEPLWNTAGLLAGLQAFQASQYSIQGVGSVHIVGPMSGTDAATVQGYLDNLAKGYVYTRCFVDVRDASPPALYSGTAETETVWMGAIQTDYSTLSARRIVAGAGHWNMPSAFPQPASAGAPSYRRNASWAAAARQVTIPPQRHLGKVKDGNLAQIVVNASADPQDGFIYHDERINPGLDYLIADTGGRFMSTMTRTGNPGVYITNPLTMSPLGSDFFLMPLGSVMDVFASLVHTVGQQSIDDDVRLNANGTIYETDARSIESAIAGAANAAMFATKEISQPVGAGPDSSTSSIIVDRNRNVRATNGVSLAGTIVARGYILSMDVTLSYLNPNAAV